MTANEYQRQRAEDNGEVPFEEARVLYSLGIAGEAGEVADYMKKVIGHGKEFDRTKLVDELGDVLWYVSQLANIHNITLHEVMFHNTAKLRERYPNGFHGDLPHWSEREVKP
jgi:NTP pyrophosphatase (non-canonical NTP hydrolase)